MFCGCSYFSHKTRTFKSGSKLEQFFITMKEHNTNALIMFALGFLIQLLILALNKMNQNNPNSGLGWNLTWLLLSRPLYCIGFSLIVMPLIVGNEGLSHFIRAFSHHYWVPFSKLTFGVFLCNSMLLEFRTFNLTNGTWVESSEILLLFLSYLIVSFFFSFTAHLFVEAPMASLLNHFFVAKSKKEQKEQQIYYSQSAKAHLRDKRKRNPSS